MIAFWSAASKTLYPVALAIGVDESNPESAHEAGLEATVPLARDEQVDGQ